MRPEEMAKKFDELMSDPIFPDKLKETKDMEEASQLFNEAGLPVSAEMLTELLAAMQDGNELTEENLETVAGGVGAILGAGGAAIAWTWNNLVVGKNGKTTDSSQSKIQNIVDFWYKAGRKLNLW